jgi:hypothetical protein
VVRVRSELRRAHGVLSQQSFELTRDCSDNTYNYLLPVPSPFHANHFLCSAYRILNVYLDRTLYFPLYFWYLSFLCFIKLNVQLHHDDPSRFLLPDLALNCYRCSRPPAIDCDIQAIVLRNPIFPEEACCAWNHARICRLDRNSQHL